MRLLRFDRGELLSKVRDALRDRARDHFDMADVKICGVFWYWIGYWYLGLRVKRPGGKAKYYRVQENYWGKEMRSFCVARQLQPFDWRRYRVDLLKGDVEPAMTRLKAKHERKHLQQKASGASS